MIGDEDLFMSSEDDSGTVQDCNTNENGTEPGPKPEPEPKQ